MTVDSKYYDFKKNEKPGKRRGLSKNQMYGNGKKQCFGKITKIEIGVMTVIFFGFRFLDMHLHICA